MFAIGFDLLLHQTRTTHPKSVSQAYADIGAVLNRYGFTRVQGRALERFYGFYEVVMELALKKAAR